MKRVMTLAGSDEYNVGWSRLVQKKELNNKVCGRFLGGFQKKKKICIPFVLIYFY